MLNNLYKKFKDLDILYSQRDDIFLKSQHSHNHKLLKEVINDIWRLRDFIKNNKISSEDTLKVENIAKNKIYKVHGLDEIHCILEILNILQYSDIKELLLGLIEKTREDIKNLEITEKISVYNELNNLSEDTEIYKYLDELIDKDIDLFLKSVDLDPVKLDKWICNLRDLYLILKNKQTCKCTKLVNEYVRHEILYLQVSIKIIDNSNLVEDLIFLISKINQRSKVFEVNLGSRIGNAIVSSGIKFTEEEKERIYANM